ncbi:MAG: oligosaccharide flippase family protein [Clostridiales bacterium]|nr:oligosaccharide flippase family protein [Clostridiales bacterium]
MKKAKKLVMNTLLLTASSFAMQTVSVSFNVYLTNRMGAAGIGLFQLIMSVYAMAVTFACGGIRLASTRLTADTLSLGSSTARRTVKSCICYGLFTAAVTAGILYFASGIISSKWLGDMRAVPSLKILAFCLPFVSMSSAINGYYTAVRTIYKYAVIQAMEQGVKITVVALILERAVSKGLEYSCMSVVTGMLASEIFSYICSFIICFKSKTAKKTNEKEHISLDKILHIAVPDAVGTGARSILITIEHLLIPKGFKKSGSSAEQAMSVYGVIHGMVFPVILYPSAVLSSLAGLLIPEMSECRAKNQRGKIIQITETVINITLIYSLCIAGVMYCFGSALSNIIYKTQQATGYIQLLAPLIPIMYLDMGVDGILKGLDQQVYTMRVNILDSSICVVLVYLLLPRYAVKGYIFILFASEIINFYLSMRRLITVTQSDFLRLRSFLKAAAGAVITFIILKSGKLLFGISEIGTKAGLGASIALFMLVYSATVYLTGGFTRDDIRRLRSFLR